LLDRALSQFRAINDGRETLGQVLAPLAPMEAAWRANVKADVGRFDYRARLEEHSRSTTTRRSTRRIDGGMAPRESGQSLTKRLSEASPLKPLANLTAWIGGGFNFASGDVDHMLCPLVEIAASGMLGYLLDCHTLMSFSITLSASARASRIVA
jgi:hypothetical protein